MSLLVTVQSGLIMFHTAGSADHVIGGSAVYLLGPPRHSPKCGCWRCGRGFFRRVRAAFANPNIDTAGLERRRAAKLPLEGHLRPNDERGHDASRAISTSSSKPRRACRHSFQDSKVVFLAATHPNLQLDLLGQCKSPKLHDCRHPRPVDQAISRRIARRIQALSTASCSMTRSAPADQASSTS